MKITVKGGAGGLKGLKSGCGCWTWAIISTIFLEGVKKLRTSQTSINMKIYHKTEHANSAMMILSAFCSLVVLYVRDTYNFIAGYDHCKVQQGVKLKTSHAVTEWSHRQSLSRQKSHGFVLLVYLHLAEVFCYTWISVNFLFRYSKSPVHDVYKHGEQSHGTFGVTDSVE